MSFLFRLILPLLCSLFVLAAPAHAWEASGTRDIVLHTRDGNQLPIGTVSFTPRGERIAFTLHLDEKRFKDFFLSMKEFKCLESSEEILCHLPYPYPNPGSITPDDLTWLEHALLFLYKRPTDFGAKLWNGLYYKMQITPDGIVGTPQAIDLNLISAPPTTPDIPPFGPGERSDIPPGSRWIERLIIR